MHVAVCTHGTAGDHHPFLAIAEELVRRGHRVSLLAHPWFASQAERLGFAVHLAGRPREDDTAGSPLEHIGGPNAT